MRLPPRIWPRLLREQPDLEVWLDVERLQPGQRWVAAIEQALEQPSALLLYVGQQGSPGGIDLETRVALDRSA